MLGQNDPMARALVIHHDANSSVGLLGEILRAEGFDLDEHFVCTELDSPIATGPMPGLQGIDLVVPLGSRWSVYDRESIGGWVDDELDLLRAADDLGTPVLGICFGGQMLAAAHGGKVLPADQFEIGWFDVGAHHAGGLESGPWFQWHLDRFEVPARATELARNHVGAQAFRLRRNLGLQFHPEVDRSVLDEWFITDRDHVIECGIDPDALLARTDANVTGSRIRTRDLVRWFLAEIAP